MIFRFKAILIKTLRDIFVETDKLILKHTEMQRTRIGQIMLEIMIKLEDILPDFKNIMSIVIKTLSDQIRSVPQPCSTLCNPMNRSTPGLPVHHQLPEFTQTHVHRVSDAIQPSHPLSSPSPPAPNPSQHQSLFQ